MKNILYIFNGNEKIEISVENFYEHDLIKNINPQEAFTLYQATRVYQNTLETVDKLIKDKKIKMPDDSTVKPEYIDKVNRGVEFLDKVVRDLVGDEVADSLYKVLEDLLKEEDIENDDSLKKYVTNDE